MGTPAYMSPEQWKNSKNVDWRADAYSVGCLAFEMVAGRPPFVAETIGEACAKHLTEEPPRLSSVVGSPPPALDHLIASLLSKDPAGRPATMRDIGATFASLGELGTAATMLPGASTSLPLAAAASSVPIPMMHASVPATVGTARPPITTLGAAAGSPQAPSRAPRQRALIPLVIAGVALAGIVIVLAVALTRTPTDSSDDLLTLNAPTPTAPPQTTTPSVAPASPALAGEDRPAAAPVEATAPTPVPPPTTPSATAQKGMLTITSTPACSIVIDGRAFGSTPKTKIELTAGKHRVQLASKRDQIDESFTVDIQAGQTLKVAKSYARRTAAATPPPSTPPPSTPPTTPGTTPRNCDEVSCVLNNYEGACCAVFRKNKTGKSKGDATPSPPKPASDLPESIDRGMIVAGINPVKSRVMACGDNSPAKGSVKVAVKVNPDGSVASVTVKQTPDAALGSCVASAIQRAHFGKSQQGGTFGYPFNF